MAFSSAFTPGTIVLNFGRCGIFPHSGAAMRVLARPADLNPRKCPARFVNWRINWPNPSPCGAGPSRSAT